MIIGQIDYINLLPFTLFIKQHKNAKLFKIMRHHRGSPAHINNLFSTKSIESGFVSSIISKKYSKLNVGIIAKKKIYSVIVCDGENQEDSESKTSNILAKILATQGKVIIGDKALKVYFKNNENFQDLATLWYEKYKLPFVFAVFCVNKNHTFYKNLIKQFLKKKIHIPQYILERYSKKTDISKKNISIYLSQIHYKVERKEKKALKKFLTLSKDFF